MVRDSAGEQQKQKMRNTPTKLPWSAALIVHKVMSYFTTLEKSCAAKGYMSVL
jgi:hypothetical protein